MRSVIAIVGCCAVLVAGCGDGDAVTSDRAGCVFPANASGTFPTETLEDWRSYADHLIVFKVAAVDEPDDGLPVATARTDRVLWSAQDAPRPPRAFDLRIRPDRFRVDDVYVSPIVRMDDDRSDRNPAEWAPLAYCAPLLLEDGRVVKSTSDALRRKLSGRSPQEVADALRAQQPDPLAERYRDLRPVERVQAVIQAGGFDDDYRASRAKRGG